MARQKRKRAYGSGCVVQRGNRWRIKWYEDGKARYKGGYTSRDEGELVLKQIGADLAHGRPGPKTDKAPTLGTLFQLWIERREKTHRSAKEDLYRWRKHLKPWLATRRPHEVTPALLRKIIEAKLSEGLSSTTVRLLVMEVSGFFTDIVEQGHATHNPMRILPRSTRRLIRPAHDPRTTPFLEKKDDIRRVYLALSEHEPVHIAFALGVFAGLRTGETLGLRWEHVDLRSRRMHIRESVDGPLKDDDSRVVPIIDTLLPILKAWKLKTGGQGTVVPPMRSDGQFCDDHTLRDRLRPILVHLKLLPANDTDQDNAGKRRPRLTWYRCTRHTFASHWVMDGRPIEKLKEILGHSTVQVTERYAHLKVDLFRPEDLAALTVDLAPGAARTGAIGATLVPDEEETAPSDAINS